MKRLLWLFGFCLILVFCQQPTEPDWLQGRIVFLGDSITQDGRYVSIIEYELFKQYPHSNFDLISIGLSSETVSGLTEPNHSYPRPDLHDRLDRALTTLQPSTVFACYGMNDGIYHPQSEERMAAYQQGIQKLIDKVHAINAQLILLTPPIFDAAVIPEKVVGREAVQFGYASPYEDYNNVLADYAEWLKSLDVEDVRVCDLNGPMLEYTQSRRAENPDFALSQDGVHPQLAGHALMAIETLQCLGVPVAETDPQAYASELESDSLYQLVQQRRRMRSMAWLLEIGFEKPGNYEALPVDQAEEQALIIKEDILNRINAEH